MLTIFDHFQQSWQFLTIFTIFDNLNHFWQFWHILTFFVCKYGIFVAKIYKNTLIDSFQGSAGFHNNTIAIAILLYNIDYMNLFSPQTMPAAPATNIMYEKNQKVPGEGMKFSPPPTTYLRFRFRIHAGNKHCFSFRDPLQHSWSLLQQHHFHRWHNYHLT